MNANITLDQGISVTLRLCLYSIYAHANKCTMEIKFYLWNIIQYKIAGENIHSNAKRLL